MNHSPTMRLLERLQERGRDVKPSGKCQWMAQCPAHDDRKPSLSITKGDGGRALVHCHAGCATEAVVDAVGLTMADLCPDGMKPGRDADARMRAKRSNGKPAPTYPNVDAAKQAVAKLTHGQCVGEWPYHYADGGEAMRVLRFETAKGKDYRPIHHADDGWRIGDPPDLLPLYRLPDLPSDGAIYAVEGEKAADALRQLGLPATTSAHGAKSAKRSDWRPLAGREVVILPDHDKPGQAYADEVAAILLKLDRATRVRIVKLPGLPNGGDAVDFIAARADSDAAAIVDEIETLADECKPISPADVLGGAVTVCLADVESRELAWLWPGRIPLGKLTMLAGDPGLGKSFVTLDMAARVSAGMPWPDSADTINPAGSVLLLTAEDDLGDTIRPRLDAAGADVRRIHAITATRQPGEHERMFNLARDLQELEHLLASISDVRLAIIDPITAYLGGTDSHKNADVRGLLSPLSELASRYGVAVVAINHLNKSAGSNAQYRMSGSLAFVAAARAGWLVTKDRDDPARRLMLPAKSNLAPDTTGLAYTLTESHVPNIAAVAWDSTPVTMTAGEALEADNDAESSDRNDAVEWLRAALADGPVAASDIKREAEANSISLRTLRRAQKALGIKPTRSGWGAAGQWMWALPEATAAT